MAEFPRFLDAPYALEKNRIDRAMARLRDRAYGRTAPLLEVIPRGALPWDPADGRRHGLRGEEPP